MRWGILSDTHDRVERTKAGVGLLVNAGAEALIHCGDITIPEVVYELAPLPSYFVFGNCDFDLDELRRAIASIGGTCLERGGLIERDGRRLAVTHGDSRPGTGASRGGAARLPVLRPYPPGPRYPARTDPVHQPRCPPSCRDVDRGLVGLRERAAGDVAGPERHDEAMKHWGHDLAPAG